MHTADLVKVITFYLENDIKENVNVVTPEVLSIKEMAQIAIKACNKEHLKILFDPEKVDGQYRKDVSIDKLLTIMPNFQCMSLHDGIQRTYQYLIESDNKIRGIDINYIPQKT